MCKEKKQYKKKSTNSGFTPRFRKAFLHPRYWAIWFGIGLLAVLAYVPAKIRDPFWASVGRFVGKLAKGARRRARINLLYCMPQLNEKQREQLIDNMFATAAQPMVMLAELYFRGTQSLRSRVHWHGREVLDDVQQQGRNIIFLVPHAWVIDIPAMLLAAEGKPIAVVFHHQRNLLIDYLWNKARSRFGGRLHAREKGIKPFISSVRQGFWGHYSPDEDYGADQSEFVDFFATYKATLPAIGSLMKVCQAAIVPMFPVYDYDKHRLDVYIHPPMNDLAQADNHYIARRMNEEIEALVSPYPEQYTWILKLIKTRRQGEIDPYAREDL
ncbi:lauroyl-Kdo(2)-lipid IV(A) myristoyltransferase [Candidatus Fukatsuia symbiotica]|uniref:Lipid A biosynthesis acyltransferase n=1 Tax=Candidatus Fukatsuia symbiotica TaxID=1878942 RepID=A0A2U8I6W4_9GAMM|nr:lauroyl-Kdo(2)-lipid IV(A) myristoyltransferase [Candidatus Fukatsuia symbiotica]AWK14900.1 lauroyl-Kdo(2)-lipid IV(A) myristoyltransferase [Candidatus Fukatsuia symbiotica]MEA9445248.1 lauroyl-Kdo(2)-lipid IV(A) myristoyltransferase [Candidatus Fukatsuia symbiotica]